MSIENLNENLNAVSGSDDPALTALVISLLDADMNVIQKLDDEPNDVGGLTAAELKAKFDEAGNAIKHYINNVLLPGVSDTVGEAQVRAAAEDERVSAENTRKAAESSRRAAETARARAETIRQDAEIGYVAQAKHWAEVSKEAAGGNADPADFGAVPLAGTGEDSPMTGDLRMEKSSPTLRLKNTDNGSALVLRQYLKQCWLGNYPAAGDNSNYRALILNGSGGSYPDPADHIWLAEKADGGTTKYHRVPHTGNFAALGIPRMAAGSYEGTGDWGADLPNTLSFDFAPRVILFFGEMRTANNGTDALPLVMLCDAGEYQLAGSIYGMTVGKVSVSGTTVSWYTTNDAKYSEETPFTEFGQLNGKGKTYHYAAFG